MTWKIDLVDLLDDYTTRPLRQWYDAGKAGDDSRLFIDLGVAPERLQSLATPINDIIDRYNQHGKDYLNVKDLSRCHKLGELMKLVGKLIGESAEATA